MLSDVICRCREANIRGSLQLTPCRRPLTANAPSLVLSQSARASVASVPPWAQIHVAHPKPAWRAASDATLVSSVLSCTAQRHTQIQGRLQSGFASRESGTSRANWERVAGSRTAPAAPDGVFGMILGSLGMPWSHSHGVAERPAVQRVPLAGVGDAVQTPEVGEGL